MSFNSNIKNQFDSGKLIENEIKSIISKKRLVDSRKSTIRKSMVETSRTNKSSFFNDMKDEEENKFKPSIEINNINKNEIENQSEKLKHDSKKSNVDLNNNKKKKEKDNVESSKNKNKTIENNNDISNTKRSKKKSVSNVKKNFGRNKNKSVILKESSSLIMNDKIVECVNLLEEKGNIVKRKKHKKNLLNAFRNILKFSKNNSVVTILKLLALKSVDAVVIKDYESKIY